MGGQVGGNILEGVSRLKKLIVLRFSAGLSSLTAVGIVNIKNNNGGTMGEVVRRNIRNIRFVTIGASTRTLGLSGTRIGVRVKNGLAEKLKTNTGPRMNGGTTRRDGRRMRRTLGNTSVMFIATNVNNNAKAKTTPIVTRVTHSLKTLAINIMAHPFAFRNHGHSARTTNNVTTVGRTISALVIVPGSELLRVISGDAPVLRTFHRTSGILHRNIRNVSSLVTIPKLVGLSFTSIGAVVSGGNSTLVNVNITTKRGHTTRTTGGTVSSPLLRASVSNTRNILVGVANKSGLDLCRMRRTTSVITSTSSRSIGVVFNSMVGRGLGSRVIMAIVTAKFGRRIVRPGPVEPAFKRPGSSPNVKASVGHRPGERRTPRRPMEDDRSRRPRRALSVPAFLHGHGHEEWGLVRGAPMVGLVPKIF